MVQLDFVVCEKLVAPVTLGCDFCHRFVKVIYPHAKTVEMANSCTVPIVRKSLKRTTQKRIPILNAQAVQNTYPVLTKLCIAYLDAVPPEPRVLATVVPGKSGYKMVQLLSSLYDQCQLASANGVVSINPDVSFMVLVANCGKAAQLVVRNKVLGSHLPHARVIVPKKLQWLPSLVCRTLTRQRRENENSVKAERNSNPDF